jgi:3-oxoacyl-[acyl-carrier-protein] synthase II
MLEGRSGVNALTQDWAQQLGTQIAAEVAVDPTEVLDRVKARRLDRSGQLALVAANEAWADSGLADGGVDPERLGVAMARASVACRRCCRTTTPSARRARVGSRRWRSRC